MKVWISAKSLTASGVEKATSAWILRRRDQRLSKECTCHRSASLFLGGTGCAWCNRNDAEAPTSAAIGCASSHAAAGLRRSSSCRLRNNESAVTCKYRVSTEHSGSKICYSHCPHGGTMKKAKCVKDDATGLFKVVSM